MSLRGSEGVMTAVTIDWAQLANFAALVTLAVAAFVVVPVRPADRAARDEPMDRAERVRRP